MSSLRLSHHNDCPRCPVIGAEDIPGEEYYQILSLRFNVTLAKELFARHDLTRVEPSALSRWLEHARILESHVWHLPVNAGHGIPGSRQRVAGVHPEDAQGQLPAQAPRPLALAQAQERQVRKLDHAATAHPAACASLPEIG
jgi:hypothetical protein